MDLNPQDHGGGDELAVGIDLGTTYSCIGVYRNGGVEIVLDEGGFKIVPSMVAFKGQERQIGRQARNDAISNPKNTIFDAKRMIGRKMTDPNLKNNIENFPFTIKGDKQDRPQIEVDYQGQTKLFYPEQISAMVLQKMV